MDNLPADHRFLTDLQSQYRQHGDQPLNLRFLFFWGHTKKAEEDYITQSCFSQWYPAKFVVDGRTYYNAEQFMMANKALLFTTDVDDDIRDNNLNVFEEIMNTTDPSVIKKFGRAVLGFDETRWAEKRFDIVKQGNYHKFAQNPELLQFLVGTAKKYDVIVEASPVDGIWGIGLAQSATESVDPTQWRGLNLLGFALTQVRDQLIAENNKIK